MILIKFLQHISIQMGNIIFFRKSWITRYLLIVIRRFCRLWVICFKFEIEGLEVSTVAVAIPFKYILKSPQNWYQEYNEDLDQQVTIFVSVDMSVLSGHFKIQITTSHPTLSKFETSTHYLNTSPNIIVDQTQNLISYDSRYLQIIRQV